MSIPSQTCRLLVEIYNSTNKLLDRRLKKSDFRHKNNEEKLKRYPRSKAGRSRRRKGKDLETPKKLAGKFNLDSSSCPSIINFVPCNASPLSNLDSILTANGTIFPTQSAHIEVTATAGTASQLPCVVCPQKDENLAYVLDCTRQ